MLIQIFWKKTKSVDAIDEAHWKGRQFALDSVFMKWRLNEKANEKRGIHHCQLIEISWKEDSSRTLPNDNNIVSLKKSQG